MRKFAIPIALLLSGCGQDRPPRPTAEESERLNEAATMLDQLEPQNEAGPEKASALPDPGNRSDRVS